ncbi:hypothetical protein WH87_04785 [Devosia epidermidihirudinis]|uniref:Uncharacterized protein n=1 Tax=Devosia epidermidihirudinis TaxID=1293439 RepID=A0A0F5QHL5_9HYPH|nr:hypothetical protein [Devosia epidermidihirudinis]KKC39514.1 hypothetical protein WH87_04785 [Devosia epidermidihirudinis]
MRREQIPTDTYTLVGLGVAAVVVLWLVFSVLKKVFGLVLLAAILGAGFMLWHNPEMLHWAMSLVDGRR